MFWVRSSCFVLANAVSVPRETGVAVVSVSNTTERRVRVRAPESCSGGGDVGSKKRQMLRLLLFSQLLVVLFEPFLGAVQSLQLVPVSAEWL